VPYFGQAAKVPLLGFVLGQRGFHSIQFSLRLSASVVEKIHRDT
jgi:Uma2 family endonuclease